VHDAIAVCSSPGSQQVLAHPYTASWWLSYMDCRVPACLGHPAGVFVGESAMKILHLYSHSNIQTPPFVVWRVNHSAPAACDIAVIFL
jgi:hypothetical protein